MRMLESHLEGEAVGEKELGERGDGQRNGGVQDQVWRETGPEARKINENLPKLWTKLLRMRFLP